MSGRSVVVVGGGIVGLTTARAVLEAEPDATITLLEKEPTLAAHQTGRNSGVIHSGIYYPPGSAKASMVAEGRRLLVGFMDQHALPYEFCGKVVVAVDQNEVPRLDALEDRGRGHGLNIDRLDPGQLRDHEPHASGIAALFVPETGICDYGAVCGALGKDLASAGATVRMGSRVVGIEERPTGVRVSIDGGAEVEADWLVNCAGLHSDRVSQLARPDGHATKRHPTDTSIMPFRGEYYELRAAAARLVRHLIYPVPDPRFPFLGVHFTRMVSGHIHAGPNAVLALAREGYDWRTIDRTDLFEVASNPGAWKLARKYWRTGAAEVHRSLSTSAFVRALQRLVPDITADDLVRSNAGIRAQALRRNGELVDDFAFADGPRSVHVVNAPSPAATASMAIGTSIASRLLRRTD